MLSSSSTPINHLYKIIILGEAGIGKTSLIARYVYDQFTSVYKSTIGYDFLNKDLINDEGNIRLQIWDSSGKERFRSINPALIRGADGVVLAFSISDKKSFEQIKYWHQQAMENGVDKPVMLVACKNDLANNREVTSEEAIAYAKSINASYIETSAKENINVTQAFESLSVEIYKREVAAATVMPVEDNFNYLVAVQGLQTECASYKAYLTKNLQSMIQAERKKYVSHKPNALDINFTVEDLLERGQGIIKGYSNLPLTKDQKKLFQTAEKLFAVDKLSKTLETGTDKDKFSFFILAYNRDDIKTPLNADPDSRGIQFLRFLLGVITFGVYAYKRGKTLGCPTLGKPYFFQSRDKVFATKVEKEFENQVRMSNTRKH